MFFFPFRPHFLGGYERREMRNERPDESNGDLEDNRELQPQPVLQSMYQELQEGVGRYRDSMGIEWKLKIPRNVAKVSPCHHSARRIIVNEKYFSEK